MAVSEAADISFPHCSWADLAAGSGRAYREATLQRLNPTAWLYYPTHIPLHCPACQHPASPIQSISALVSRPKAGGSGGLPDLLTLSYSGFSLLPRDCGLESCSFYNDYSSGELRFDIQHPFTSVVLLLLKCAEWGFFFPLSEIIKGFFWTCCLFLQYVYQYIVKKYRNIKCSVSWSSLYSHYTSCRASPPLMPLVVKTNPSLKNEAFWWHAVSTTVLDWVGLNFVKLGEGGFVFELALIYISY